MAGDDGHGAGGATQIPCVTLNTGHAMPVLGFGTGASHKPADLPDTIVYAVRLGYYHLDTASLYGTEPAVGAAVAEAVRAGAACSRADFFVASKLWIPDARPGRVVPALRESLARLGLDYLDLFLVHWPVAGADPADKGTLVEFDMEGVWRGMEECHRLGLARSVGVSNFSAAKMERLLALADVPPAVNQVEMNVGWRQEKVREVCARHGVVIAAYSPLGAYGAFWGSDAVMHSGVMHDVAAAKGKTVAQVALRWLYEQGVCFVARSFNKERLKQNMEIFDWELSEEEKGMIATIPQRRACQGEHFVSPDGPYKSLEELWDEQNAAPANPAAIPPHSWTRRLPSATRKSTLLGMTPPPCTTGGEAILVNRNLSFRIFKTAPPSRRHRMGNDELDAPKNEELEEVNPRTPELQRALTPEEEQIDRKHTTAGTSTSLAPPAEALPTPTLYTDAIRGPPSLPPPKRPAEAEGSVEIGAGEVEDVHGLHAHGI